jgi:hypothetical protein
MTVLSLVTSVLPPTHRLRLNVAQHKYGTAPGIIRPLEADTYQELRRHD